ncbi:MAG: GreA/GreB family elongation factor [Verrucomicrobiae bacterium]|nr:GreA/GreB family elongation factor [Verrucomicrobiae bacterium]
MREEFEKLEAVGKIQHRHVDALVALAQAGYCVHKGWGFGRIRQVDPVFSRFIIDFPNKPGHSMDLAFAAESLKPIPSTHILVRKAEDIDSLRQMAAVRQVDLIKLVLESFGGKATVDQIKEVLVPDVISEDWKKWWETTRRELKRDGHFIIPLKKTDPIVYQAEEATLTERLMSEFKAAKGLKARLSVAAELLRNKDELPDRLEAFTEAVELLNQEIASHQRTMPALALEAIFMRDDLRAAADVPNLEGELTAADIWRQVENPGPVLEQIPTQKQRRALQSFRASRPDDWHKVILDFFNTISAKLCSECASMLVEHGHLADLKQTLARLINQHEANSELLLWLAKERSDAYADILGPEVFRGMLAAMERDQFNDKKTNRLRDYILDDQDLLIELIESADIEVIKDLTRTLQFSPCFDDMDKRSLLARIVKKCPAVQSLITSDHSRQDTTLLVSWESLERRKREYDELVHKKIPANSRDIAIARSYGDLAENHEYKAAKEMQRILLLRKQELENQLVRARGTDFSNPRTDVVSIGTRVTGTDLQSGQRESFVILGAWDFDPEKHIISYLSPIAQAMLNKKVGDEVELQLEGHIKRYRIENIEPWKTSSQAGTNAQGVAPEAGPEQSLMQPSPMSDQPPSELTASAGESEVEGRLSAGSPAEPGNEGDQVVPSDVPVEETEVFSKSPGPGGATAGT